MKNSFQSGSLLQLLRIVSPALPVGAYAGSEGLEYAVEAGWVSNEEQALEWIRGRLRHSLTHLDIPLLARFQAAWSLDDQASLDAWSAFLDASRETSELAAHDRSLGRALARLLADLGIERAESLSQQSDVSYVCAFALATDHWGIDLISSAHGYLFAWCESQVAAAVKLVPLGQTQGQRVIGALVGEIPDQVDRGLAISDSEIGLSEPGLAIASALHETQYSRLFRS